MSALLAIEGLEVSLRASGVAIVVGADLEVARGEVVALVGESGSGKTTLALAVPRLLAPALAITAGAIRFEGRDLARASESELLSVRGARIGFLFQDPLAAFNPVMRIGAQVGESLRAHRGLTREATRARVLELLAQVELAEPQRVAEAWPHELSGGMRQRAALAMALACEPALLIADEPTSALDALTASAVLASLRRLARERDLGLLLVTHDFGVVARAADRAAVMYAGSLVEGAQARELLAAPAHPYTRALLACSPTRVRRGEPLTPIAGRASLPTERPAGCAFHPRCAMARDECSRETPQLVAVRAAHVVACPFHSDGAPA